MGFQTTVRIDQADATLGEVRFGSPYAADPKIIVSTSAVNNVIARAVQQVANQDDIVTADAGAAGVFAGILINPKAYSLQGTTAGTLESSITLRNNEAVEVLTRGSITVALTTAGNIGDEVLYNYTNGELSARAPSEDPLPADTARVPGGRVIRRNVPAPSGGETTVLAYIKVGAPV